jgi:hypothetical protein
VIVLLYFCRLFYILCYYLLEYCVYECYATMLVVSITLKVFDHVVDCFVFWRHLGLITQTTQCTGQSQLVVCNAERNGKYYHLFL